MSKLAAALASLALAAVAGTALAQTQTPPPANPTTAPPAAPKPAITWPIGRLLADTKAAAVLEKHLPGLANHPARPQFEGMTLEAVAPYSEGAITAAIIAAIDADLKALPAA